jgi:hypothetical protein
MAGDPDKPAPPRSLLIAGCITRAEPGNATKRMAGMGLEASHLDAHLRLSLATEGSLTVFDEFDVHVKSAKTLPPPRRCRHRHAYRGRAPRDAEGRRVEGCRSSRRGSDWRKCSNRWPN